METINSYDRNAQEYYYRTININMSAKMTSMFGEESFCNTIKDRQKISSHQEIPETKTLNKKLINKEHIVKELAKYKQCKETEIITGRNKRLKKIAIYFCKRLTNETQNEIGKFFSDISYSGISQICKRMTVELENNKQLKKEINVLEDIFSNVKT